MVNTNLWVEDDRPLTLDQYVFQSEQHRATITKMIEDQSIPHLLLCGVQGTGKTTLARILIQAMNIPESDVLEINGSSERGIDTFRDKIYNFATSMPLGKFKIVYLEEASALTVPAQEALKHLMEEVADTVRFVIVSNYLNKIVPPIRSRCQELLFKQADINDVTANMVVLLKKKGVKFALKDLDNVINTFYPDIRKIINTLQQNTIEGHLVSRVDGVSSDWQTKLLPLLDQGDWQEIRQILASSINAEDWILVYRYLYDNLNKCNRFSKIEQWEAGIATIAEHLYKHSIVADPEINATAMFITLSNI